MAMKIPKKPFTIQSKMLSSKESTSQSDEQVKPRKTRKQQPKDKTRSWHLQHSRSSEDPVNLLTTTTLLLVDCPLPQKSATSTVRTLEVELSSATVRTQHQTNAVVKAELRLGDSGMSLSPSGFYRSRGRIARWEFAVEVFSSLTDDEPVRTTDGARRQKRAITWVDL